MFVNKSAQFNYVPHDVTTTLLKPSIVPVLGVLRAMQVSVQGRRTSVTGAA